MKRIFAAPWAISLKVISFLSTVLLLTIICLIHLPEHREWLALVIRGSLLMLLVGCALFTVRAYEVEDGWMNVRRLIWVTRIPLRTLTNAELRHGPFGWAWRTCGNGGLYSFTGWYYQKPLGAFRAMATRASDAVILRFSDRKPIVITPEDPAGFVAAVEAAAI